MVSTYLGYRHAAHVTGVHLNMVIAFPPDPANPADGLTQDELVPLMEAQQFLKEETGYQRIQGTKPQTLSYALNDSPAGLAAWIVEKFRTWSDCGGEVERRFSKDELLTNIMLYWVPETANSSCRLYCETMREREVSAHRLPGRRADRLRDLSPRADPPAAAVGGKELQRRALDPDARRRPLRCAGGAAAAGGGHPGVLPAAARGVRRKPRCVKCEELHPSGRVRGAARYASRPT